MIEALVHPCAPLWLRDGQSHKQSMTPAEIGKGFLLNHINTATAVAAVKLREDDEAARRVAGWKPFPCLLTRRELQALIAEQLG
ncbi:hypothetical protein HB775_33755 (plasmid) [Rhizobium leguminosarum bv. trifolii]|nr:hypothetical protein HB775_33755 [Rhizobium leguminosarum bv. trifolii]